MLKIFFGLFVCFVSSLALKCYVSDFTPEVESFKKNYYEMKDCGEHLNEIVGKNGTEKREIKAELRCYTAIISKEDAENLVIKGCFPLSGCDRLEKSFQNILEDGSVECTECSEDGCNLVTRKINSDVSSSRTIYCSLIFVVLALAVFSF